MGKKLKRYQKVGVFLLVVVISGFVGWLYEFVCLRSVLVFGVSALFLVYVVVPFCVKLSQKMSKRAFLVLAISLFSLVMLDEVSNLVLKNLGQPTAMDFWRGLGLKYPTG